MTNFISARGAVPTQFRADRVVVVSPHMDDAVLSVGGLLRLIASSRTVRLLTVFDETAWSLSHGHCTSASAAITAMRRAEDRHYARVLGAEYVSMNLRDASLRGYNELTERGEVRDDPAWCRHVTRQLVQAVNSAEASVVLCPAAIGGHVDHVLVARALAAWQRETPAARVLSYEDLPYAAEGGIADTDLGTGFIRIEVPIGSVLDQKCDDLGLYSSEVDARLKNIVRRHAHETSGKSAVERLWMREDSQVRALAGAVCVDEYDKD